MPKLNPSRHTAPPLATSTQPSPFVSTWRDLPATAERRAPIGFGPRVALVLATFGGLLLSFVAPLS